jgi:hypothetical protein
MIIVIVVDVKNNKKNKKRNNKSIIMTSSSKRALLRKGSLPDWAEPRPRGSGRSLKPGPYGVGCAQNNSWRV